MATTRRPRFLQSLRNSWPGRRGATAAFSLIELLLGLLVLMVIGGAVFATIPRSLDFATALSGRVRTAAAADAFDRTFDRDFSAIVPELGFDGDPSGCAFWTMRPQADGTFDLRYVSYMASGKGIALGVLAPEDFFALAGTNAFAALPLEERQALARHPGETFATDVAPFRYGGTNLEEAVSIECWTTPTNAPARISTALSFRPGAPIARLFRRRTLP